MTDDPNRKSLRQFQCRDYLWETFEQMSQELECSTDYLINEAMRHYARSQGKLRQTMAPNGPARPAPPAPASQMGPMQGGQRPMPNGGMGRPPGPPPMANGARPPSPMSGPPGMGYSGAPPRSMPAAPPSMQPGYPSRPAPQAAPPPQYPQASGIPVLYAVFEGQKYPIVKDEFYIGRSNKSCDLIVKDPNVSRQHARVVRHQGQYWMVDMGSTNGIEFQGTRVDRKPIGEGDSFRICDHEIVFTYR